MSTVLYFYAYRCMLLTFFFIFPLSVSCAAGTRCCYGLNLCLCVPAKQLTTQDTLPSHLHAGFETFTAMKIQVAVFWIV